MENTKLFKGGCTFIFYILSYLILDLNFFMNIRQSLYNIVFEKNTKIIIYLNSLLSKNQIKFFE